MKEVFTLTLQNKHPLPEMRILHEAFPYQQRAFEEVKDLPYAAIFHEQGLGKTKIAIDLMDYWLRNQLVDTVLILTKKQLVANWDRELYFHTGVHPFVLNNDAQNNYYVFNSPAKTLVTNFETLITEHDRFEIYLQTRDVAIIIDESAKFKNPKTKLATVLFELRQYFKIRVIMSGTPIANRPYDIWSQIYFLDGGESLGADFKEFKSKTNLSNDLKTRPDKQAIFEDSVAKIFSSISSFTVRETKADAGIISLPSKTIHEIEVELSTVQKVMYEQVRTEMCLVIEKGDKSILDDSSESLKRLTRLLELASSPRLVDDSYRELSGKEAQLDLLITEILEKNERCIIWSNFIGNVDYFTRKYSAQDAVKIHGKMSIEERNRSVEKFQRGDSRLLFATPQAAKEGLTLTVANHAIFYDRGFNLDDYLQAQDRIHRISQEKDCHVYNLVAENTIDVWISKLLGAKALAAALGQGDIAVNEYKSEADYSYCNLVLDVLGLKGDIYG